MLEIQNEALAARAGGDAQGKKAGPNGKRKASQEDSDSDAMHLDAPMSDGDEDEDDDNEEVDGERGADGPPVPMPESGGIQELRDKLHARMAQLRNRSRGRMYGGGGDAGWGGGEPGSRDELLEERRQQRAAMRERRRKETREKIKREEERRGKGKDKGKEKEREKQKGTQTQVRAVSLSIMRVRSLMRTFALRRHSCSYQMRAANLVLSIAMARHPSSPPSLFPHLLLGRQLPSTKGTCRRQPQTPRRLSHSSPRTRRSWLHCQKRNALHERSAKSGTRRMRAPRA